MDYVLTMRTDLCAQLYRHQYQHSSLLCFALTEWFHLLFVNLLTDMLQNVSPLSLFFSSRIWVCWDTEGIQCEIGLGLCLDAVITCVNLNCSFSWITAFKRCFLLCQKAVYQGLGFFPFLFQSMAQQVGQPICFMFSRQVYVQSTPQDKMLGPTLLSNNPDFQFPFSIHDIHLSFGVVKSSRAVHLVTLFYSLTTAFPQKKGKDNGGRGREAIDFSSNKTLLFIWV